MPRRTNADGSDWLGGGVSANLTTGQQCTAAGLRRDGSNYAQRMFKRGSIRLRLATKAVHEDCSTTEVGNAPTAYAKMRSDFNDPRLTG